MRTPGLIGGTGWVSTLEYYRLLNEGMARRLGDFGDRSVIRPDPWRCARRWGRM